MEETTPGVAAMRGRQDPQVIMPACVNLRILGLVPQSPSGLVLGVSRVKSCALPDLAWVQSF